MAELAALLRCAPQRLAVRPGTALLSLTLEIGPPPPSLAAYDAPREAGGPGGAGRPAGAAGAHGAARVRGGVGEDGWAATAAELLARLGHLATAAPEERRRLMSAAPAAAAGGGVLGLLEAVRGPLRVLPRVHRGALAALAFEPGGARLFTAGRADGALAAWRVLRGGGGGRAGRKGGLSGRALLALQAAARQALQVRPSRARLHAS